MESKLDKLYNDPSSAAAFAGINQLLTEAKKVDPKIKKKDVTNYLEGHRTYSIHRPRRVRFPKSKTVPSGYLTDLQVDLADFQKLSHKNKGYKYCLVGIDVLSKQVFAAPLKSKEPKPMIEGFRKIFKQMKMVPHRIYSDKGGEFNSGEIKKFFKENELEKYKPNASTIKAALAERCIRNLKQRLYRYMSEKQTLNWTNVLDQIVNGINHSKSRVLGGLRPVDVNFENAREIWEKNYGPIENLMRKSRAKKKPRFKKDDFVRMTKNKSIFAKGYLPNYSDNIMQVDVVKKSKPTRYRVRDERDEPYEGYFYEHELAPARRDETTTYRIEEILETRGKKGKEEYYVKFFDDPIPQWINKSHFA